MTWQELKAIGLANPKGRILGHHTLEIEVFRKDARNIGNWKGTDCNRDVFTDIKRGIKKLSSIPKTLIGSHETLEIMMSPDPYADGYSRSRLVDDYPQLLVWDSIMPLFYQSLNAFPDMGFIKFDDTADPGIVLLVGTEGDVVYIDTR